MFILFRERKNHNSSHRWYRRLDGRRIPTWAMVQINIFNRRYRSGDGVYNVEPRGIVMKMSDYDNGVYR